MGATGADRVRSAQSLDQGPEDVRRDVRDKLWASKVLGIGPLSEAEREALFQGLPETFGGLIAIAGGQGRVQRRSAAVAARRPG